MIRFVEYIFSYLLKDSGHEYDKEDLIETNKIESPEINNRPKEINPYSYFICAFLPGANNFYLPYILNPVDNESYVDHVGDYGQFMGAIIGIGIGASIYLLLFL